MERMIKRGDIFYAELNPAHHLSRYLRLSAGHGVPLHTLMLITITKRKYLANEYSVVKEQSRFRHTKENWARRFLSSHPVADGKV